MSSINASLSLALFLLSIGVVYYRYFLNRIEFDLISAFNLGIGIFYGLIPFVIFANPKVATSLFWINYIDINSPHYIILFFSSVTIMLLSNLAWFITGVLLYRKRRDDRLICQQLDLSRANKWYYMTSLALLVSSIVFYYMYCKAYGGFTGILSHIDEIRSEVVVIDNKWSFLQRFGGLSILSSFIILGVLKSDIRLRHMTIFIISFAFSVYVIYTWAARAQLLYYFISIGAVLLYNIRSRVVKYVTFAIFTLLVPYMYAGANSFLGRESLQDDTSPLASIIDESSFPLASFMSIADPGNHIQFRHFVDVAISPLYLIPLKFWPSGITTASSLNTFNLTGSTMYGSIPTDFATFSWIQFGVLGIALMSVVIGSVLYIIDSSIKNISHNGVRMAIYCNVMIVLAFASVAYGDPSHILRRMFYLIIGVPILVVINSMCTRLTGYERSITCISSSVQLGAPNEV